MDCKLHLFSSVGQSISAYKCKEGRGGPIKDASRPEGRKGMSVRSVGLCHSGHDDEKNPEHMNHREHCTAMDRLRNLTALEQDTL